MNKIDLLEVHENKEEWDVQNKASSAYRLLLYISENEGLFVGNDTFKEICENYNSGMINQLFDSLVKEELIYKDYIPPSARDMGWFLSEKGKALISN